MAALATCYFLPRKVTRLFIYAYRYTLSPCLGPCCRFQPSCSEYALDALLLHGFIKGSYLTLLRLLRCHPFGGHGYDPLPKKVGK